MPRSTNVCLRGALQKRQRAVVAVLFVCSVFGSRSSITSVLLISLFKCDNLLFGLSPCGFRFKISDSEAPSGCDGRLAPRWCNRNDGRDVRPTLTWPEQAVRPLAVLRQPGLSGRMECRNEQRCREGHTGRLKGSGPRASPSPGPLRP